jgi:hypothetical protein
MAHFLDDLPFDPGREESQVLLGILNNTYFSADRTQTLLRGIRVGSNGTTSTFPIADISWEKPASTFWVDILVTARNRLLLRDLVKVLLEDNNTLAYRDQLHALLKPPVEAPVKADSGDPAPTAGSVLEDPTWDLVARLLASHVLRAEEPRQSLAAVLPEALLGGLPLNGDVDQNLRAAIDALKASPVLGGSPPILDTLKRMLALQVIAALPESEFLTAAIQSVREFVARHLARPANLDPLDEFVLFNGEVFLNRSRVREGIKGLLGPKLALVVKGPPDSGKSYCSRLLLHTARRKGFKVAKVTHEEAASPEQFVDFLRMSMKIREPFTTRETDQEKWIRHASRWLVSEAQSAGGKYWFVIDGFNESRVDACIKELITALTQYIAEETDGSLRVILLDYQDSLPSELGNRVLKEELAYLKETDVREFFTNFFGEPRKDVPGPVDEYIEVVVKEAWLTAEDRRKIEPERHFMDLLKEEVERIISVHA